MEDDFDEIYIPATMAASAAVARGGSRNLKGLSGAIPPLEYFENKVLMHSETLYADLMAALVCSSQLLKLYQRGGGAIEPPRPPPPHLDPPQTPTGAPIGR